HDHRAATAGATAVTELEAGDRSEQLGGHPRHRRRVRVQQFVVVGEGLGLLQCLHVSTSWVITCLHPPRGRYSPAAYPGFGQVLRWAASGARSASPFTGACTLTADRLRPKNVAAAPAMRVTKPMMARYRVPGPAPVNARTSAPCTPAT